MAACSPALDVQCPRALGWTGPGVGLRAAAAREELLGVGPPSPGHGVLF